jgi:hypothetical protein
MTLLTYSVSLEPRDEATYLLWPSSMRAQQQLHSLGFQVRDFYEAARLAESGLGTIPTQLSIPSGSPWVRWYRFSGSERLPFTDTMIYFRRPVRFADVARATHYRVTRESQPQLGAEDDLQAAWLRGLAFLVTELSSLFDIHEARHPLPESDQPAAPLLFFR